MICYIIQGYQVKVFLEFSRRDSSSVVLSAGALGEMPLRSDKVKTGFHFQSAVHF